MKNFVDLDRVRLRYGDDEDGIALQDMSMRVDSGEFVAVVGPSGCGKSTLMKVVTGLWPPSRGGVIVNNREVDRAAQHHRHGVPESTLLPWRTTFDNVMLPLEIAEPHASRLRRERPPTRPRRASCWSLSA